MNHWAVAGQLHRRVGLRKGLGPCLKTQLWWLKVLETWQAE
jgi:hypothetical protein